MSLPRSISVLMPTWQGLEFLERVLTSLAAQRCTIPWDFRAIDSGSSDGTWELLGRFAERFPVPFVRERIDKLEFDHGDTRNLLAARSKGELLVFLTQDAIPGSADWLATLAANFADPAVGAAYCRNTPRPDAQLLTRVFSEGDPGYALGRKETRITDADAYRRLSTHEKRLLWNFNDVASAIRRSLWERHPFPRTWFGEDVLMARALLEAGHTIVYDDVAAVEHSHDYSAKEWRERALIDARFNAEWLDRICVGTRNDARILAERQLARDREALRAARLSDSEYGEQLKLAAELRSATFEGLHEGGLSEVRYGPTRVLERSRLKLLYVVHGFPPETWAGTEIYTLNLARQMQARGHEVLVLARTARGEGPDFGIREEQFEGLRVLRMLRREPDVRLADSYRHAGAEAAFARLLLAEQPDLVHFQHLIHLSAGLVEVARELDLPTVLTCHDYWALCPRVQLIRPDGVRCEDGMDAGCFLCIKEQSLDQIPRLKATGHATGPFLDALEKGIGKGRMLPEGLRQRWEGISDLRARRPFVSGAYKAADLRISPSRFLRKVLIDKAGMPAHTTLFSDNGLRVGEARALAKRPSDNGKLRLGFVGSLVWYKGGEVLMRALQELDPARFELHVHGDFKPDSDPHHAELRRLAPAHVHFHGRFDNARIAEVYAGLDVLIVPSIWWENSPLTIHEAHIFGTPVIASNIGGMAEFVRDGIDGLQFEVGDAQDLARVLRRLADEPELLGRLSRDFPPIKSIEDDAATMEFRYRGLCARKSAFGPRAARPRLIWERTGKQSLRRDAGAEEQGASYLLLRPGSAAEYALDGAGGGRRTLLVNQFALAAERQLGLGVRVLVDGVEVGRGVLQTSGGHDGELETRLELNLSHEAQTLRIEPLPQPGVHARLSILRLLTVPGSTA